MEINNFNNGYKSNSTIIKATHFIDDLVWGNSYPHIGQLSEVFGTSTAQAGHSFVIALTLIFLNFNYNQIDRELQEKISHA